MCVVFLFFSHLADLSIRYSCCCFCVHSLYIIPIFPCFYPKFLVMHIFSYFSCLIFLFLIDTSCLFLISVPTSYNFFYPGNVFFLFNKFIFLLFFFLFYILIPIAILYSFLEITNIFSSVSYFPSSFSYLHFFLVFYFLI